ncbi:MAG: DUF4230 domain-containing protein [Calditrichaceae bacterium]|nr:DUF4230 domain-containing protein [Calditrichaceae bacterium]
MSVKKFLRFGLVFIVIFIFAIGAVYYLIILPSQLVFRASEQIVNGFAEAFNFYPRVTTENTVIFEEQAAILEVAVYSQRLVHDFAYSNTWMGSTKRLHLRGVFLAKFGFNLKTQNFSIDIAKSDSSDSAYNLTFMMPKPILLSFEMENYRIIEDKDGWWNKINKTEREIAVNRLRGAAMEEALSVNYRNNVKNSLETQFKIMIAELPIEIRVEHINFIWQDTNPEKINIKDKEVRLN